ncbi:zinc finger protein [Trichinella spiralis]|uniref:zinc finger protein n=1 Tax=Trichinella spiralis TaxID=6334 RepID=UPI0001EFDF12|nr:zinc finger protein [Trichinella spiralis]
MTYESVSNQFDRTPAPHLEQALQSLSEWLDCAEDVIATQDLDSIDELDITAAKIQRLQVWFFAFNFYNYQMFCFGIVFRWTDIERVLTNQLTRLKAGMSKLQDWEFRASELENWMLQVKEFIQAEKPALGNTETLKAQLEQSQALMNDIETLVPKIQQMETWVHELELNCKPRVGEYLRARMEDIDSRWTDVVRVTEAKHESLNKAYTQSKVIFDEVQQLTQWLWSVEQEIQTFGNPSSGKELHTMIKQHKEFERLMEGSGGHNRIIEIANTLNNENFLSNAVRNELAKYMAKRDKVLEPAKERQKFLETDAREAQKIEQQLHECLSWISRVDFITRARSECDILASDIPQEYKMLFSRGELLLKLYDEFDEHKECIFDLEKQVAQYQQLGLQQAAGRLAEQVNHLKKQMCDVQSRLEQYKQPSELDDRLRRVERILEDLEQSFTLLTVATDDLDEIDQLLEKVEVTLEALNELQCEIDDLKDTASKQNARSSIALDDIDDVENHLKAFFSKISETKENFQEIRRMLATASTNLQNCNELLNEMETNLRKWDPEDPQNFDERCKRCLNYRREISNCNQYLKEMESYVKKFMHLTQGQSTSKLDGILLVFRNRIKNLTNKLDEWSMDYQHSKLEQVEAQKKFYNLHAAVSSMLNTAEKEITSSNRDLKVLKEELATRSSSTSESDDQASISLSMLFGKDGNNGDNDESNDVSMISEDTIRVGSSTPVASESSDFTDRLLVQTTELAKSINSVEELLGASEQDFKMLQSKIGDVSNTIEACSTNVNQLLHQSEQANKIELRPNVLSIVNKLEHMDSKLKLLDGKIKSIIEANERFQQRYDTLNNNAKNLLSNLVFLETMNTDEVKNCQEGLTNVENSLTDLLVTTKEEFQHLDVAFPESSADSLYKLLQQAQSNITVHVKQLEEKANAKAKMDAFIVESAKVKEECSKLERKLSLCPESENFSFTGLTERETEFQDLTENVEQLKDRIGKLWNLHDSVSHQYLDESEQANVKQIVDELNIHLDSLEKTYMEHFSLFQAALQQWQSLHQRLYSVMAWLEHVENRLIPSISINDPEATKITDSVMNDINNSCKEIENITQALVDMQDKYSNCLSSTDVSLLKEKLEKATYRLNSLKTKMIENRNRVKHYDLELKEEIEELLFWFDESDTLFSTLCDPTDAKQLADFKQRIEEKKSETVTKEQQLESLSSAVDNIDTDKGISEAVIIDLKENVDSLKQRLVQVKEDVDQKLQLYDQKINQCNQFWDQLRQMSIWAQNMKNLLLEYKSATIYTPARFDPDALDAEIKSKKEEIEDFIASYNAIREEAELSDVKLCSSTEHAVKQLYNSWAGILRMTELFESSSRSTSEEDEDAVVVQQDSSTAPETQRLTSTDAPISPMLNAGKNLQELIRWSHWLSDMTLESVVFCKLHDSSEIRAAMKKEQSFLSQLNANEKHVLKILETDQNVDVLFKEVERRRIELVEMLENCRTWDDLRVEIEVFLSSTEKKISSAKVSDVPIDKLQRELVALEQLATEMDIYRKKMTDFNEISNFIVESYVHDDASTLSQITSNMNTLWSKINDNLRIRKAVLEASCRGRKDFFTALQEFSCWLGKIESQILSLDADSSLAQLLKDVAYRQELRDKWKGVSGEIEVHETVFHSLCDTAKTLLMNSMFSEEKSDFQGELMQLNERWEQVVKLSDEIKQRLDLAQEQWERLTTQLQELICWTEDASRELLRQQPIAGDSEKIKLQNEFIQQLQTGISNQEKAVKEIIQIARSYLLQQDLRPALQSSMDSDETEEMLVGKKQSRRVGQMIKNDSDRLEELWADLTDSANDWQKLVEDTFTKMILFDKAIEDCKIAISEAEDLKKHWKPISDVKLDELAECMEHARGFHQYLICHIRLLLDDVNDHSSRLLADNVRLSPVMIHSLESLNLRYKELELTIGDRIVILQNALRQFGPSSQHFLEVDLISIEDLVDIFNQRKLQDANDNQLDVSEMVMTLLPIYELVQRDNMNLLRSIPLAVDLCLNWLLNVYDPARTGNTRVISFKVALILMCRASLSEKYRYLFNQVSYNKCSLDQKKLALLLHECIQVPKFFGEVAAFGGTNIEPSVRSCFEMAKYPAEVTMQQCMDWLNCEPQSIVWLAAMHRISISENEKHQAKCNVCKMFPIVGLRYRCLKCFNFDMCQNCFFAQRTAKNHKISHPMQEYYKAAKSGEDVRDFGRVIRNRFKSKHYWKKHPRLGYLPVQSVMEGHSLESRDLVPTNPETQNIHVQIELYASHLADMERSAITESNESEDDEHAVISSLSSTLTNDCHVKQHPVNMAGAVRSPAQIISVTDSAQKVELNGLLKHLQNENKNLMCEYEKLRNKMSAEVDKSAASLHNSLSTPMLPMTNGSLGRRGQHRSTSSLSRTHHQRIAPPATYDDPAMDLDMDTILSEEKEIIANEAKALRQQKQRLEQRSKVLEEHNQQLEVQLRRIKQLIEEQKQNGITCIDSSKSQLMLSSGISSQADAMTHCGNDDSLVLSDTCSSSSNRIGDLMSTVQDIGKAVGNLINAVTSDDEVSMAEVE